MYALDDGEDLGQARVRRVEVLSQSCEMSRVKELTFRNSVFSQQKLTENSRWLRALCILNWEKQLFY